MPGRTAACFRAAAVAAVVALIVVPLSPASSGPVLAQVPPPGAGSGDDFQTDGPEQKAADLERAAANGGASPDRLVVVYRNAPSANHPARLQVRQQIGGQLLRALGSINE